MTLMVRYIPVARTYHSSIAFVNFLFVVISDVISVDHVSEHIGLNLECPTNKYLFVVKWVDRVSEQIGFTWGAAPFDPQNDADGQRGFAGMNASSPLNDSCDLR